jgi:diacylglycerol kinase (ATP)
MTGFVVNPASGSGRAGRLWPQIAAALPAHFERYETRLTSRPGDATRLACELLHAGATRIIAAGGDGTVHEVANAGCPCIGVLPLGSAGDFARIVGVPREWEAALPWLAAAEPLAMDLGLATCTSDSGATRSRYFINMASFGLGGRVVQRRRMPYLLAAVSELQSGEPAHFALTLDGKTLATRAIHVAVGNGRYQGKGMNLCPNAHLDDGLLDVTIIEPLGLLELAKDIRKIYSGAILEHPKVHPFLVRTLRAEADRPVAVELDGEPAGYLPLEIEVAPEAVQVLVRG